MTTWECFLQVSLVTLLIRPEMHEFVPQLIRVQVNFAKIASWVERVGHEWCRSPRWSTSKLGKKGCRSPRRRTLNLARSHGLNMKKHVMSLRGAALKLWRENGRRTRQVEEKHILVEKGSRSPQHLPWGYTSTEVEVLLLKLAIVNVYFLFWNGFLVECLK